MKAAAQVPIGGMKDSHLPNGNEGVRHNGGCADQTGWSVDLYEGVYAYAVSREDVIRAAVAGASGYAGGELLRLLNSHPSVQLGAVTAASSAGDKLADHHANLSSLGDITIEDTNLGTLGGHDVVFLALPHGHSAALAAALPPEVLVIDLGADFRLEDESAWDSFYGGTYAGSWPYALAELPGRRTELKDAERIAVPGCYPTASTLALWPAYEAGSIEFDVTIAAASGTSGAGRSSRVNLIGSEVMGSMTPYGVGGVHRHSPEIEQNLSLIAGHPVTVSFTPMLAPMSRGMLAICTAKVKEGVTTSDARAVYAKAYEDETFVTLLEENVWPQTSSVFGSNAAHVQVTVDEHSRRLIAVSAIDNLGKGAAGAAVQAMNIAFGFDESTGLSNVGVAP